MLETLHRKKHLTSFQFIILGFAGIIFVGALLLMLPISSATGTITPFNEALFTSTSAVCVTGLVVQDTGSYWSFVGQLIILILIQTGGLGVVTVAAFVFMLSGRKKSSLCSAAPCKMPFQHRQSAALSVDKIYFKKELLSLNF